MQKTNKEEDQQELILGGDFNDITEKQQNSKLVIGVMLVRVSFAEFAI